MDLVDYLYFWTNTVLYWGLIVFRAWAFGDCLTRKRAAFPAVDKLTKPAWATILAVSGFLGSFFSAPTTSGVVSILSLASVIVASIYLADVRPAVREIADGR